MQSFTITGNSYVLHRRQQGCHREKNNTGIARHAASIVGGIFPRDPACLGGRRGEIAAWCCISTSTAIMNYCFVKVSSRWLSWSCVCCSLTGSSPSWTADLELLGFSLSFPNLSHDPSKLPEKSSGWPIGDIWPCHYGWARCCWLVLDCLPTKKTSRWRKIYL